MALFDQADWGDHPNCPGSPIVAQRGQIIASAQQIIGTPPPPKESEMNAVVMPNGDIKVYAAGAGDRAGHLLEFTRHDADQSNSVIDITDEIGTGDPYLVAP